MRESRTYGSVRGALSNERPYRDRWAQSMFEMGPGADQARKFRSDTQAGPDSQAGNVGLGVRSLHPMTAVTLHFLSPFALIETAVQYRGTATHD